MLSMVIAGMFFTFRKIVLRVLLSCLSLESCSGARFLLQDHTAATSVIIWLPCSLPCFPSCLTGSPESASLVSHLYTNHCLRVSLFFGFNLSFYLSICLSIYLSIYLSNYLPTYLPFLSSLINIWLGFERAILVRAKRQRMCFAYWIVLDIVLDNDGFWSCSI